MKTSAKKDAKNKYGSFAAAITIKLDKSDIHVNI